MISLVVLDMAGTTVCDDGTVDAAFAQALDSLGLPETDVERETAERIVAETMGQSKIEVFTLIFGPDRAAEANAAFEESYAEQIRAGRVSAVPGIPAVFEELRAAGVSICLTTGFSARTRDLVIDALGWWSSIDLALCPADAGRGRPWPDMIWTAMLRLHADSAAAVLVAGDTASDVRSGTASGAGAVVGVLSGAGTRTELEAAGAGHVLADLTELPALLARLAT